jgi:hypothetical protein
MAYDPDEPDDDEGVDDGYEPHDPMLLAYVRAVELGAELGLTITVPGATISGILISRRAFRVAHSAELAEGARGADLHRLARGVEETLAGELALADALAPDTNDLDEVPEDLTYLHLRAARFLSGGALVPSVGRPGALWRGRLEDVTGWSLGSLG